MESNSSVTLQQLDQLLDRMWHDYVSMNPQACQIHELLTGLGEKVLNDHIALRTFDVPKVGIDVLARPFVAAGYVERGRYEFPAKKLLARHYEHPSDRPKIFVSELRVAELAPEAQAIIHGLVEAIDPARTERLDFCASGRPWSLTHAACEALRVHSEYAAWVAAFGFRPNHFTVDVGSLRAFGSIEALNALLKEHGFVLNASGGEVKGSPATLLEQSSVLANVIDVPFDDGVHRVPGCYYEFARRYPMADGRTYQGFIASSADRIFESTDKH
ncbi:MAG: DUF1338 domain-containing protein [Deltaproteobacteria bacterium]|nr:DUF1338 domain-containing protein [Deltaproteobacteria bacterium]